MPLSQNVVHTMESGWGCGAALWFVRAQYGHHTAAVKAVAAGIDLSLVFAFDAHELDSHGARTKGVQIVSVFGHEHATCGGLVFGALGCELVPTERRKERGEGRLAA